MLNKDEIIILRTVKIAPLFILLLSIIAETMLIKSEKAQSKPKS